MGSIERNKVTKKPIYFKQKKVSKQGSESLYLERVAFNCQGLLKL